MLAAFLALIGCQLLGELLCSALHLPVPGAVIGMLVLAACLALRGDGKQLDDTQAASALDRTTGVLLEHMGLLFVPAGVGIIAQFGLLRQQWMPVVVALIGSTVLGLMVTGFVMHRFVQTAPAEANAMSAVSQVTRTAS